MAGKRQHYIPRYLQSGFLDDPYHKAKRTWLHRRNMSALLVATKSIGVSENFYSKIRSDGAKTLDDIITEIEVDILHEFSAFKNAREGEAVDSKAAARLTVHLVLRTAHLRSLFEQGAVKAFDAAIPIFSDSDIIRRHINLDDSGGSVELKKMIDQALCALSGEELSMPVPLVCRILEFRVRENFESFFEEKNSTIIQVLKDILLPVQDQIRDAHNKILEASKQTVWEDELSKLSWRVQEVVGAILPDCVALARVVGKELSPLIFNGAKNIDLVIFPISHNRLLIGRADNHNAIDIKTVNVASATCSDSFFISHRNEDGEGLSQYIGQKSTNTIDAAVKEAVFSFRLAEHEKNNDNSLPSKSIQAASDSSSSFSLTFKDFGDAEMVKGIGNILQAVIGELGQDIPISALDGVTFSQDYPAAILEIDRGGAFVSKSQPRDYGRPVAKSVRVIREGKVKVHLVVDALIAYLLLSNKEEDVSYSIHLLLAQLSEVLHASFYEPLLESDRNAEIDGVSKMLFSSVSHAPISYFCARKSAFFDMNAGESYAALVKDSYASAKEKICSARMDYRVSDNIEMLLNTALPQLSFFLTHAAEWLGHRDGLPESEFFPGSKLLDDLEVLELNLWLELFGRDLRELYDTEGQFTTKNIFSLSRHVERILWTFQICPWLMEDGTIYVTVPFDDDLAALSVDL
ncbi:hypothetical protein [Pseudomonas coronafaciens]|uniref:hypothetical protein n=1 Tax=Pseudomonas coronafaciens TaxID=53409 RepID=UPI000E3CCFF2|nr:hypothetical protein [Pseudomonas coronafaciens]